MGGERDGSVSVHGNGNATSGGVHPPATAPVVAANMWSGNGNAGKGSAGGLVVEKVKFTVSERGRQRSSARHVNETLEDFAAVIERDAQRLASIDSDDSIQRLQMAYSDDSEPKDLNVDAMLSDVIICMGDKQLLANPRASGNFIPPESPSSLQFQPMETACSFHPDYVAVKGVSLPPLPRPNGKLNMSGAGKPASGPSAVQQQLCNSTPSPAELANMPVRSSSHRMPGLGVPSVPGTTGVSASSNTRSPATPTAGFQSFASALLSRLQILPNQSIQCPHGATINIALLVQFLTSQFRAFSTPGAMLPTPASCGDHKAPKVKNPVANAVMNLVTKASPACNLLAEKENCPVKENRPAKENRREKENRRVPGVQANNLGSLNHPGGAIDAKRSLSGVTSHGNSEEKSPSSTYSSAIVRNSLAPQSRDGEGVDSELPSGDSELVFPVYRRSKTRVGTYHLKMSDLSAHFHLSVVNAAKKLRVSQTTLKKACRKFGLKRWPGRKVRSLQSTIAGLLNEIAVGQRGGSELTEDYMWSEVCKLRQEMDQLVHGTPAQVTQKMHSPAVKTARLYKLLYPRGHRSKYYSAGRHDMITLDTGTGNPTKRASGLAPPSFRKYRKAAKENQER